MSTSAQLQPQSLQTQAQYILNNLSTFLPHFVFWKDVNSIYLGCNENYAQYLGLASPNDIVGLTDYELPGEYYRAHAEEFRAGDRRTMAGDPVNNQDYIAPLDNGGAAHYLVNKRAIYDERGLVIGVLGFVTDITEQKQNERELVAAKQQAERAALANRIQSEFIANISHDLRTPLNGVLGMAERLKRLNHDPQYQETIDCIIQGSHTLLSLVEDILNVAKLEAGKLPVHNEPFDLKHLIENALATITYTAQQKNVELKVDYSSQIPRQFIGDPNRIKRVIMNLLGNSIKFTDQGHVAVNVKALSQQGDQIQLRIDVQDTGAGIPRDKVAKIFERFETAEEGHSYKSSKHGAGLGLTIVKEFIEGLGGQIQVESEEQVGTTFSCELPLQVQSDQMQATTWAEQYPQVKVLVVDDNAKRGLALMAKIGIAQATHIDSKKVAELLQENSAVQNFQIILIDDEITLFGAVKLCQLFNQNHRFANTLKIAIGTNTDHTYRDNLQSNGFFTYLKRQADTQDVLAELTEQWHKWESLQSSGSTLLLNLNAKVLLVEDNALNQRVVSILLEELGCEVSVADKGAKAIDLVKNGNFDVLLLDIGLPDIDGITVAKMIREQEAGGTRLPIVALTGHVLNEDKNICLEAGMDWFLTKPISSDVLGQCLSKLLLK